MVTEDQLVNNTSTGIIDKEVSFEGCCGDDGNCCGESVEGEKGDDFGGVEPHDDCVESNGDCMVCTNFDCGSNLNSTEKDVLDY